MQGTHIMMRTLVLNAGYEPVQLISWQKALCLVISCKAEVVAEYGQLIRTVSSAFAMPSVVRLKRYVRTVRHFTLARCTRRNVLLRDRYQCQYCGVVCRPGTITIDHILPRCRGGRTVWDNVVAACHTCNRRKGDLSLADSGLRLRTNPRRPNWRELLEESQTDTVSDWLPFLNLAG